MGDIDDDLSSLLVPDLDFTAIANAPAAPAMPKLPAPVQIGALWNCSLEPALPALCMPGDCVHADKLRMVLC
jgi:hypothetical protein